MTGAVKPLLDAREGFRALGVVAERTGEPERSLATTGAPTVEDVCGSGGLSWPPLYLVSVVQTECGSEFLIETVCKTEDGAAALRAFAAIAIVAPQARVHLYVSLHDRTRGYQFGRILVAAGGRFRLKPEDDLAELARERGAL